MATLTHNNGYPCAFDLNLLRWERYESEAGKNSEVKTVPSGEPYTLWIECRMALRVGERLIYQSEKDTTLILEDLEWLIQHLRQLACGETDKMAFDPIEPDFGLTICRLSESDASVMISSGAEIGAEMPTGATNQSTELSDLFDVSVWIDYPNQVSHIYGGYGPGLYFLSEAEEIERFASQLQGELDALGPYKSLSGL